MAVNKKKLKPISPGYDVIYPPDCKEITDDLRIDELKRRLKDLSQSLSNIAESESEQDSQDEASISQTNGDSEKSEMSLYLDMVRSTNVEKKNKQMRGLLMYLCSEQYTCHPDQDVRLRVACCLVHIVKLFCPDNPFAGMEEAPKFIKHVLDFILECIRLLGKLKSKQDTHFIKLYTILSTCCRIDIFVWCTMVEDGQKVLHEIFRTFFHIFRTIKVWSWLDEDKVKAIIQDTISKLIQHSESIIGQETISLLLHYLIEPAKSTEPEQHEFAKSVILRNITHMEYHIHMIIQSALVTGKDDSMISTKTKKLSKKKSDLDLDGESVEEEEESEDEENGKSHVGGMISELGDDMFQIIYALHSIKESLVAPILPTIEVKLKSSNMRDRKRACRLLVRLFAERGSSLPTVQPGLWEAFLGRFNDIEHDVRENCVRLAPHLLKNNPDLPRTELLEALKLRVHDPQESVRQNVLRTVASLVKESLSDIPEDLYSILIERARDKSLFIRKEVLSSLAGIYRSMVTSGLGGNKMVTTLNTIMHLYYQQSTDDRITVERLFKSLIVPYNQKPSEKMKALVQAYCLFDEPSVKAMQEMFKVQFTIVTLLRETVLLLVDNQNQKISGQVNKDIVDKLSKITVYLPNGDKSLEHLKKFFNQAHTDRTLRQYLVKLTSSTCSCSKATDIVKEILKRQSSGTTEHPAATATALVTLKVLLERAAPVILDPEAGQELVMQLVVVWETPASSQSSTSSISAISSQRALRLILAVAVYFREILPPDDLVDYIIGMLTARLDLDHEGDPTDELCLQVLNSLLGGGASGLGNEKLGSTATGDEHSISRISCEQAADKADRLLPILERFCTSSGSKDSPMKEKPVTVPAKRGRKPLATSSSQSNSEPSTTSIENKTSAGGLISCRWVQDCRRAKFSLRCIYRLYLLAEGNTAALKQKIKATLENVVKKSISCSQDSASYIPSLTSLGHIGLLFPTMFNKEIKNMITKELIRKVLLREPAKPEKDNKKLLTVWIQDSEISHLTRIKMMSIKLISRWLVGVKTDDKALVQAIIRMLYNVIVSEGDITRQGNISGGEMCRLRIVAATSWLRLAQVQNYVTMIEVAWFQSMACIICDPCEEVRSMFLSKLHRGLFKLKLPLEYLAILSYAADVGDAKFRQAAKQSLHSNVVRRKDFINKHPSYSNDAKLLAALLPEYLLPYSVYLLAHDPEWKDPNDTAKLNKIKICLWFVMEPIVVRGDSFSFLRKLIETMKHSRDAVTPDDSVANQKLYAVCDLALGLVLSKSTNLVLKEYPVDVKLPKALFARAPRDFVNVEFSQLANTGVQFTPTKHAKQELRDGLLPANLIKGNHHNVKKDLASPSSKSDRRLEFSQSSGPPSSSQQSATGASPARKRPNISLLGYTDTDAKDIINISPSKKPRQISPNKKTAAKQRGRPKGSPNKSNLNTEENSAEDGDLNIHQESVVSPKKRGPKRIETEEKKENSDLNVSQESVGSPKKIGSKKTITVASKEEAKRDTVSKNKITEESADEENVLDTSQKSTKSPRKTTKPALKKGESVSLELPKKGGSKQSTTPVTIKKTISNKVAETMENSEKDSSEVLDLNTSQESLESPKKRSKQVSNTAGLKKGKAIPARKLIASKNNFNKDSSEEEFDEKKTNSRRESPNKKGTKQVAKLSVKKGRAKPQIKNVKDKKESQTLEVTPKQSRSIKRLASKVDEEIPKRRKIETPSKKGGSSQPSSNASSPSKTAKKTPVLENPIKNLNIRSRREASRSAILDLYKSGGGKS